MRPNPTVVVLSVALFGASPAAAIGAETVQRISVNEAAVTWPDPDPLSVYTTNEPWAVSPDAQLVARDAQGGRIEADATQGTRPIFLLPDGGDGSIV